MTATPVFALQLQQASTVLEITADDRAPLTWLAEFLSPAFSIVPDANDTGPQRRIRFSVDAAEHARLCARLDTAPLRDLEGLTYDGHFSLHRGWMDDDGRTWVFDDDADAFYGVDRDRVGIHVVVPRGESRERVALMRVVRELATTVGLRRGALPVHGAAVLCDGGVSLICGQKMSGKTSMLIHGLRSGGTFVSNDRVFLSTGPVWASGMPTIVSLRNGALAFFDELRLAYDAARFDRGRTIDECAPGRERPAPRKAAHMDRPGLSGAQFCHLLNAPMLAGGPVRRFVFPRPDPTAPGMIFERLDRDDALALLRASLLKPGERVRGSQIFSIDDRREDIAEADEIARCLALLEAVPAYRCRLGPAAYETNLFSTMPA